MEEEIGKFGCRCENFKLGKSYTINGFVSPYWQYILKDIKKGTLIFFFFLNTGQFRS